MARQVIEYSLLISCPGDIIEEIFIIEEVVNEFNKMYSDVLGILVRTKHWSKDSYAESGDKPQELLNKQFVLDCDATVSVFWSRFGTATDRYGSGTEEEIEHMLEAGKQVFMYFSDVPLPPSKHNEKQYMKIKEFKEKYKGKGLYFEYATHEQFKILLLAHISQYFLSVQKMKELQIKSVPKIVLKCINEQHQLMDKLFVLPLDTTKYANKDIIINEIRSLFSKINNYKVGKRNAIADMYSSISFKDVKVEDNIIQNITAISKQIGIELAIDFFDLGNLRKNILSGISILGGGYSLEGSEDEKNKYDDINRLHNKLLFAFDWFP